MSASANPNLRNGIYSSTYLRELEPEGGFLLVQPAGGLIGYLDKQRIYSNAYPYLREAAKRFREKTGRALYVIEAWRSEATQQEYWRRYQNGTGNLAAYPGTSNHGYGIAFDLGSNIDSWSSPEHAAFVEVASPLGFTFPVASEAWHAVWDYSKVTSTDWAGSGAVPIPEVDTLSAEEVRQINAYTEAAAQVTRQLILDQISVVEGVARHTDAGAAEAAVAAGKAANSAEQARTRIGADLDGRLATLSETTATNVWSTVVGDLQKPVSQGIKLDQAWSRSGDSSKRASTIIVHLKTIAAKVGAVLRTDLPE